MVRLEGEVESVRREVFRGEEVWRERERELGQSLQQGEVIRRSLLQQVGREGKVGLL